jgi:hypothetical protein
MITDTIKKHTITRADFDSPFVIGELIIIVKNVLAMAIVLNIS